MDAELHKTMGEYLRRVVRRKRTLFIKTLDFSDDQLSELRQNDLLTENDFSESAFLEGTARTVKVVDSLVLDNQDKQTVFLDLLREDRPWLYDEICAEIRAEMCTLPIEDHVVDDAATIVHRHFGNSRRFSERDKKLMTSLVATKAQVAQEVWKGRLDETKKQYEKLQKLYAERDELVRNTSKTVKDFLKKYEMDLYDVTHDMKSTTQTLMGPTGSNSEDPLPDLIRRIEILLTRFTRVMMERQHFCKQKKDVLDVLETEDTSAPLHKVVAKAIGSFREENIASRKELKALKHKAILMEDELMKRQAKLDKMNTDIENLRQQVAGYDSMAASQGQPLRSMSPSASHPKVTETNLVRPKPEEREHEPRVPPKMTVRKKPTPTPQMRFKSKTSAGRHCLLEL